MSRNILERKPSFIGCVSLADRCLAPGGLTASALMFHSSGWRSSSQCKYIDNPDAVAAIIVRIPAQADGARLVPLESTVDISSTSVLRDEASIHQATDEHQ
ncbi:hypothetical protein G3N95_20305 [Paraburkholderia sp. Tr-20389]|uniref:hypothetical protein n=1 Tax=Paraburkholderia sp. Tr-20389 TaxID=2703903 RepID=UPI001981E8FB|nr:hypothetical protein [Paraburkholderia sp. Tr-20389]MBN3755299.1 hypothetical protein [Paraburkholderia sp. Tr-20389]